MKIYYRPNGRSPEIDKPEEAQFQAPTLILSDAITNPIVIGRIRTNVRFRGLAIIAKFTRYGLAQKWSRARGRYSDAEAAERLREIFQEFGGLWIKVGQLMSLRTDVLPEAVCRSLSTLQSRAEGFDPSVARQTLETALGEPVEAVFSRFDAAPFAAASVAQAHYAILREIDAPVIVKIQRPDVEESFQRDLRFLKNVVGVIHFLGMLRWMQFDELLWEIEEVMKEECDYRYEATNLKRLRRNLRRHDIIAPKPYLNYCTSHTMVMEFLPGALMSGYIALRRSDPQRADAWLKENDIDPEDVAQRLVSSLLRQVFEENLFHGDLHPGNIMLMQGGKVAFIDFGTAGTLEQNFLEIYSMAVAAIIQKNFRRAADYILALCAAVPSSNLARVRDEMVRGFRAWEMRSNLHNATYFERALSTANAEINQILARHQIQPSWALLKLGRTLGTLDATLSELIPDGDVSNLYATYYRERAARAATPQALVHRVAKAHADASEVMREVRTLFIPYLRNRTLALRGSVDRIAVATAIVFSYGRILILGVSVLVFLNVIDLADIFENDRNKTLEGVFGWLPGDFVHWLITGVGLLFAARMLRRAAKILKAD